MAARSSNKWRFIAAGKPLPESVFQQTCSQSKTPAAPSPGVCVLARGMDALYEKILNIWVV
jgi:hypothetical protein